MRFLFVFIVSLHGLIHVMGFAKAFKLADIHLLSQSISKPIGMLWLLASILFLLSMALYVLKMDWWLVMSMIAVVLSQILIVMFWNDAKFGTIVNSIVLLVGMSAYGSLQFNSMVQMESEQIMQNLEVDKSPLVSENDVSHLPEIVQHWMRNSNVVGKEKAVSVRIDQIGEMRTKPEGKWMPFTAVQYVNAKNPAFVWTTKVDAMPVVTMVGRDKLYNGKGAMLIKLAGLLPVVNERDNTQINQGAMIRFLAEISWFPSAALNEYLTWEAIDSTSARATMTINNTSVSGVFTFSNNGDLVSFKAARYYGGKSNAKLEDWTVKMDSYKVFNGIKIPNKSTVVWELKDGDFKWLVLEIIDVAYNVTPKQETEH